MQILQPENRPSTLAFLEKHLPLSLPALSFVADASLEQLKECLVLLQGQEVDGFLRVASDGHLQFIGDLEAAGPLTTKVPITRIYASPANAQKIWKLVKQPAQEPFFVRELYFHLKLSEAKAESPDPDVRLLKADDFPAWFKCYTGLLQDWGAPNSWISPSVEKSFQARVQEEQVLGLFRGTELASTAAFSDVYQGWSRIGWVYTGPNHRKQGLAQKVMRNLLDQAKRKHLSDLALYTNEKNYRAHHLYEPFGFKVVSDVGLVGIKNE